jgi:hypothetical protein
MKITFWITVFGVSMLASQCRAQDGTQSADAAPRSDHRSPAFSTEDKLRYYFTETYWNASTFTAPAFRASIRMANPPGKGATQYPSEWRQGVGGFGRNYGDAFAERVTYHTARFLTGVVTREDPCYKPSTSRNILARSLHAIGYSFIDRSDSGHRMPAISNFAGAMAVGFVGNSYLPSGFNDVTHAGQRATFRFGTLAAGNLFREFAPQMPKAVRSVFQLIAR